MNRTLLTKAPTSWTASLSKSIRIDRAFFLPPYVKAALQKLGEAGHIAYVVGGSVRDFLLEQDSKDHDIATSALPDDLVKLFPKALLVGKSFGVIKVPTGSEPPFLEIATFRKDLDYEDHRHPKEVIFSGPVEDAQRRDFTINALFFDPKTSRIFDVTGGIEDLKIGMIRAIGNPDERFREDALRLLRAVRFKANLGFHLHPHTAEAIRNRAKFVTRVSSERIRDELTLMWSGPRPAEALRALSELGLLASILPEVEALKTKASFGHPDEDIWEHLIKMLGFLALQNKIRSNCLSWAALLHEIGKTVAVRMSGGNTVSGQEIASVKLAQQIATRLKMSRSDCDRISLMVGHHLKFKDVFQMREATLQRFIREDYFEELLAFHKADAMALDGNLAFYEFCLSRFELLKKAPPGESVRPIDGKDLIQLGFQPGPEFSEILRVVEDLFFEKKITTKEEALEYVIRNFVN